MEKNAVQEVLAEPVEVIMDCYHCCPVLGCKNKLNRKTLLVQQQDKQMMQDINLLVYS